jgi:hypothetical protein
VDRGRDRRAGRDPSRGARDHRGGPVSGPDPATRRPCAAFHHEPDAAGLFTLGWCHGPPGLGWLFRQLELTTGDPSWRTWLRRAARTDTASGIPERKAPGFWDNVARCCGSASVAEFFLDLHRLEGNPADLEFARLLVDDLLGRAITDGTGTRWSNYEFRAAEPDLPPETGSQMTRNDESHGKSRLISCDLSWLTAGIRGAAPQMTPQCQCQASRQQRRPPRDPETLAPHSL